MGQIKKSRTFVGWVLGPSAPALNAKRIAR